MFRLSNPYLSAAHVAPSGMVVLFLLLGSLPFPGQAQQVDRPGLGGANRLSTQQSSTQASVDVSLVKDIAPEGTDARIDRLTNVNGTLFFAAYDGEGGQALWKSDGTKEGTQVVEDIVSGNLEARIDYLTGVGGTLFFVADDGSGRELWASDGTKAGTRLVKDIRSGSAGSDPRALTNVGGTLFFSANDGTNGRELWKSDGTKAGTQLVKDIRSSQETGRDGSSPEGLTNFNGVLFFSADDGNNGRELWKSDGTKAGTQLVKGIASSIGMYPQGMTVVDGTLFFSGRISSVEGRELWKSDGTEDGTQLVKNIGDPYESDPRELTNVDGTLFFSAGDGTGFSSDEEGRELWKSDGTKEGTELVRDIDAESSVDPDSDSNPRGLTAVGGTLFFSANDGTHGREPWTSDGTAGGTELVRDINADSRSSISDTTTLSRFAGTVFFRATDGMNGRELWRSDGTEGGTTLFRDLNAGDPSSDPEGFTRIGKALFFRASDGTSGGGLWKAEKKIQDGLIACPNLQLDSTSAKPFAEVGISGLPKSLGAPLAAEIVDSKTDTTQFAFATREVFSVPLNPDGSASGADVELRFRGADLRCEQAVSFRIEPLPQADKEATAALDSVQSFIEYKAGLNDVSLQELREGTASTLPKITWPLAIAQRALDDIRATFEQTASQSGAAKTSGGARKDAEGDRYVDRLVERTGVDNVVSAMERQVQKSVRDIETRTGVVRNKACIPDKIANAKELSYCMKLQNRGQIDLRNPSIIPQVTGSFEKVESYLIAAFSNYAPKGLAPKVQAAIALKKIIDIIAKAPAKLAPARFVEMSVGLTKAEVVEDATTPGRWESTVQAESEEWALDSEILNVVSTFEPVGKKVQDYIGKYVPGRYRTLSDIIFDLFKTAGINSFVSATENTGSIRVPADVTSPIDITAPKWSEVSTDGLRQPTRREYLPDEFPPVITSLTVETESGLGEAFPDAISTQRTVPVRPINVSLSRITNMETGSVVNTRSRPAGCPGANPSDLKWGTRYKVEIQVENAQNPKVNLIFGVGSITDKTFDRTGPTSGTTSFVFRAPEKPSPYITYISASSASERGLRGRANAPPRAANISLRVGSSSPGGGSDCEPPPIEAITGPEGGVYGDPHLTRFGGATFDFQAVGEFILARSTQRDDPFEVQARFEPVPSASRPVSVGTAMAMNVGGDRLVIDAKRDNPIKVNGSTRTPERGAPIELSEGGVLYRTRRGFTVDWPSERYRVEALYSPSFSPPRLSNVHVYTSVGTDSTVTDSLDGLVGGFVTRDGERIDPGKFRQLYDVFGNAWRIDQAESLFGTPTFADRSFPDRQVTVEDLPAQQRTEAREICKAAGVFNSVRLRTCVLDVGVTQNSGFADDTANLTIAPPDSFLATEDVDLDVPDSIAVSIRRSFADASAPGDYRLVALPGQVDRPVSAAVSGAAGSKWQAYWDDGSGSDFFVAYDGSETFRFEPGNGFWLTSTEDWTVSGELSTVNLENGATEIPLHDGWNIISNPLDKDVDWSAVQTENSGELQPIWSFDGTFEEAGTFETAADGDAYYFLNEQGLDTLEIPYPTGPKREGASGRETAPVMALTATPAGADGPSSTVRIGISKKEETLVMAPPGRFEAVSLRIGPKEAMSTRTNLLMAERSQMQGNGKTFDLRLSSQSGQPVVVSAKNLEAVEGQSVTLLHPSTGKTYDLNAESSARIRVLQSKTTALKLAVGTDGYVEEQTETMVPEEVTLTSYPNPLRKQGTVEYTLPEPTHVQVTVYDVLGRRVAVLEEGRKRAGRHTLSVEGKRLPSGVYFARLEAEDQTRTQKITVVR